MEHPAAVPARLEATQLTAGRGRRDGQREPGDDALRRRAVRRRAPRRWAPPRPGPSAHPSAAANVPKSPVETPIHSACARPRAERGRSPPPCRSDRDPRRPASPPTRSGVRQASAPFSRLVVLQNRRSGSSRPADPGRSGQLGSGSTSPCESTGCSMRHQRRCFVGNGYSGASRLGRGRRSEASSRDRRQAFRPDPSAPPERSFARARSAEPRSVAAGECFEHPVVGGQGVAADRRTGVLDVADDGVDVLARAAPRVICVSCWSISRRSSRTSRPVNRMRSSSLSLALSMWRCASSALSASFALQICSPNSLPLRSAAPRWSSRRATSLTPQRRR